MEKKNPLEWILREPREAVSERLVRVFVVNMGFGLKNIFCNKRDGKREETDLLIVFNHSDLLFTDGAGSHHGLRLKVKRVSEEKKSLVITN